MPKKKLTVKEKDKLNEIKARASKTKHKWSGRYGATYKDMADTQKSLADLTHDKKKKRGASAKVKAAKKIAPKRTKKSHK